jgi:hypothetical protein
MLIVGRVKTSTYEEIIDKWFIEWNEGNDEYAWDALVANVLNLSLGEYRKILRKHNVFSTTDNDCYFHTKEDAKTALEELEPYLIMERLTD